MSRDEVLSRCEQARISYAPVSHPVDLMDDPHLNETGGLLDIRLPDGHQLKLPRLPLLVGDYDFGLRLHPPRIGQHTRELLAEVGYLSTEIDDFCERQMIAEQEQVPVLKR